jgi:hypothetical protein
LTIVRSSRFEEIEDDDEAENDDDSVLKWLARVVGPEVWTGG